jgi:hypothetical protein
LANVIQQGIAHLGFFILMDDRLALIFGDDFDPNDLISSRARLDAFAKTHQWRVDIVEGTVTFWSNS